MPIDLYLREPIDPEKHGEMLGDLQGNILKSHGRDHIQLLLVEFSAPPAEVCAWIRFFSANWITSAGEQLMEASAFRQNQKDDTGVFGGFMLTARGYEALGYTKDDIETSFPLFFREGMAAAQSLLNDPPPESWEEPYRPTSAAIHAMILLAADSPGVLAWACRRVDLSLAGIGRVVHSERGKVLRNANGDGIEPFGFVDGRSQPIFFKSDLEEEEQLGGTDLWNPLAPPGLVLVKDPFGPEADCLGSYVVFRKLEQNVKKFKEHTAELAGKLLKGDEELAGAFAVGRFKDGTPVIAHRRSGGGEDRDFNNFNYLHDRDGVTAARCPFHSHIRKMNPRGDSVSLGEEGGSASEAEELSRRIVRRGIPYDQRPEPDGDAETGVGFLFLCYQADIAAQFAFLQERWANNPHFPRTSIGPDPLIGQPADKSFVHRWPRQWGNSSKNAVEDKFNLSGMVILKGGDFFFVPSLRFLRRVMPPPAAGA